MILKLQLISVLLFVFSQQQFAQDIIRIQNPSFEVNTVKDSISKSEILILRGWIDFGFSNNSSPTIHSKNDNLFRVKKSPVDGAHFIGMVTRQDSTYESFYQKLSKPLLEGKSYEFSIYLCTSSRLKSSVRKKDGENDFRVRKFDQGAIFRIQGSNSKSKEFQILAETEIVSNEDWKKFEFVLKPESNYDILILEVFFDLSRSKDPICNANVLLDNCSPIVEILD